jgi:hypothetical protein
MGWALSWARSKGSYHYGRFFVAVIHCDQEGYGGPGGVRTLDLMTASHARSQLRHRPKLLGESRFFPLVARAR